MGKKLFSLCMALVLCLGLLPATALAAEEIKLFIGGQQITESGCYANQNGTWTKVGSAEPASGQFYYDAATFTLTLNKAVITNNQTVNVAEGYTYDGSVIAFSQTADVSLKIVVSQGTSTITGTGGIRVESTTGNASLSIKGSGSLDVEPKGSNSGITLCSSKNTNLDIDGADVTASSPAQHGVYLISSTDASSTSTITVNNGSLTTGGNGNVGIYYYWSGTSNAGTSSLTVSGNAVVDTRNSQIMAQNKETVVQVGAGSDGNGGIVFNGKSGTVYGDVTLQEALTIGEGESLTIPEGSTLNINNKLTNNGTINVESGGKLEGTATGNGTLKIAPTITTQPQDVEVKENETATFTVKVTGTEPLSYQWKQSTDGGQNWADIPGANSATYTIENTTTAMSGYQYHCVVTGDGGTATSNAATLTVTALPEPEPEPEPTPPPYIPPTYAVTAPETTGGTVTVSPSRASSGRTVTITAAPDTGFALESLTVLDSRGNEIALTDKGDGKYTFTMPASRVTVEASFAPAPLPFEDVAPGAWYESAVRYAYFHNIMEGMRETEFSPTTALTRAMAAQILYNLEGQPDLSSENLGYPYEDVDAQAWYGNAVYWARITGVATGYGDGTFQPGDCITRQEFAQMLYNYAKYKGYDLSAEGDLSTFPDANSIADWAEAAMRWANGNQLINGHDDGTLEPGGTATRVQAASILMQFDQNLVEN
mgnify:CR=1 FL=1